MNINFIKIIMGIMLLWALYPENPYVYYTILRIVIFISAIYISTKYYQASNEKWLWIYGIIAFIYNPIFSIHLNREIWSVVNIATIVVIVISMLKRKKKC